MKLYAVTGEHLAHTLSPFIHNKIFENLGIEATYTVIEIPGPNLPKAIEAFKTLGFAGINVTIPYKESIMDYLDCISPEAQAIGAVNTIQFDGDNAMGYNTDYFGFGSMLERHNVSIKGKDIVLFGAGGAAKALITYLHDKGAASILVVSKTDARLQALQEKYPYINTVNTAGYRPGPASIAINATPVGMYPHIEGSVAPAEWIQHYEICADIVYNPIKTKFLSLAEAQGKKTVDGLYMLIDQAPRAQEIFQNRAIPKDIGATIYNEIVPMYTYKAKSL